MNMMWLSPSESEALRLSLSVAARSVAFSLPPAIAFAWILTRRQFFGRTLLDAVVHLPLVLPPVAVGYVLLLLFGARGPIGAWLERTFGIELIFTRNGAALATAVMSFPLMVRAVRISFHKGKQNRQGKFIFRRSVSIREFYRPNPATADPRDSDADFSRSPQRGAPKGSPRSRHCGE